MLLPQRPSTNKSPSNGCNGDITLGSNVFPGLKPEIYFKCYFQPIQKKNDHYFLQELRS
jgi:hypothetical protein